MKKALRIKISICVGLASITLAFWLVGCNKPSFEIYVSPKPEVQAGGKLQIAVRVRNLEKGHQFRWSAQHGKCEPQESSSLSTDYTAPLDTGDDRVTLQVLNGEKVVYGDDIVVKVIPLTFAGQVTEAARPNDTSPAGSTAVPTGQDITGQPEIHITLLPPYDAVGGDSTAEYIEGRVSGVVPAHFKVVIFAFTDKYYVQPLTAAPFTTIGQDSKWRTWTHTGTQYVALLVRPTYNPPAKTWTMPEVGGDVIAITTAMGRK